MAALVAGLAAGGGWVLLRAREDDSQWVVSATVSSAEAADDSCGEGIAPADKGWSATSDLPPGTPAEGVHWRVTGHRRAEDVLACLVEQGAVDGVVRPPAEQKSFTDGGS